jgi:nicotinamidase-related amidase
MSVWSFRSPELLHRAHSRLVLIDVQDKLLAAIPQREQLVARCRLLAEGARLFGVPIAGTEQYPRGLGSTVSELSEFVPLPRDKLRFSAAEAVGWPPAAEADDGRRQLVLAGIEAHVCVLQSALDWLAMGYAVYVAADAVGSRCPTDRDAALHRLRDAGAVVASVESILFEWCDTAAAAEFKTLSRLLKEQMRSA